MYVVKRNGKKERVHFDKITSRISKLCYGLSDIVDPCVISRSVCNGVYVGVTTSELDTLAAETCAGYVSTHPDYGILAARIEVSNLHKNTNKKFSDVADQLYNYINVKTRRQSPLLSDDVYAFITENADRLSSAIIMERDYDYDYFGFKTLERSYLLKCGGKIVECPQHMIMRVSCGMHYKSGSVERVIETYNMMSTGIFTHATPTLFNAGTPKPQMSSCFLATIAGDSIEDICDTQKLVSIISKYAGGIGLSVHKIRASGTYIAGTNGQSNGLVPMLRVFNNIARYVDQGGGKRKGSFAIYLEPWHADIMAFLELKKNHGIEEERARDLFYGMWISDLFMKRVRDDGEWSLFCPHECPGLADCYGEEFEELYCEYESTGRQKSTIKARSVWEAIITAQQETGTPYIMYKDTVNQKSNQKNLGAIRSSNLCTEITEYTSPDEVAVCNLASICLPKFVEDGKFNHRKLFDAVRIVTRNLNTIIDTNYYPVKEAEYSNLRHRPMGIGVQGLADTFIMLRMPFESESAQELNIDIFETLYYGALYESNKIAQVDGPYETFKGSPFSKGIFQFDMWKNGPSKLSGRWDWETLRKDVVKDGVRNSLLLAPMPTASTSQIMGNNECIEPINSNIYLRRTLSGEFTCVNKHLLRDLVELGIWNNDLKNEIIRNGGSVQGVELIPADLKSLYKTVWEIPLKIQIKMAADRGVFIDQSQSLNIHMLNANYAKLSSMHFNIWNSGLKGMYYLRTKSAVDAAQVTIEPAKVDDCVSCGA